MTQFEIETDRLGMRRFLREDWRDLHEYLSDPLVVEHEPYDVLSRPEAFEEAGRRAESPAFWAVVLKENEKVIGNIYFARTKPLEAMTWEIGYVFNRNYWKYGYAAESVKKMLAYGFEVLQAHRIEACCNQQNENSWGLLERVGMKREGFFPKHIFFKRNDLGQPIWHDVCTYGIASSEWQRL